MNNIRDRLFNFSDMPTQCAHNRRVCVIDDMGHNKNDVISAIYTQIKPPFDAGHNWDALYDVLCSMEWIAEKDVVLHHVRLPQCDDKEIATYLNVLADSIENWGIDKRHVLSVEFPASSRLDIQRFMAT